MTRAPHLLVAIGNNLGEWREAVTPSTERPRLPMPYAFGAALLEAGFRLSAIDLCAPAGVTRRGDGDALPFDTIYPPEETPAALNEVDYALFWGRHAVSSLVRQTIVSPSARRLFCFSYAWQLDGSVSARHRIQQAIIRRAVHFAAGVVLMTDEQIEAARRTLPKHVPALRLTVGIDTDFYGRPISIGDVSNADREPIERLLQSPYVILPGDELRLNDDALTIVENSAITIVRVCQFVNRKAVTDLKAEIVRRKLRDRLMLFERISYRALRFLMRNASAYAGLVNASWQPAGWTAACESLASGLPLVLYEGLVSRELQRLGADPEIVRTVPLRDVDAFVTSLRSAMEPRRRHERAMKAQTFVRGALNLQRTGAAFAADLRQAIATR